MNSVGDQLLALEAKLAQELAILQYPDPVEYVYNPIEYAVIPHTQYVKSYADKSPKPILFLGMNPGPWGMAQTGVPFGEVDMVKNWLAIHGQVGQPLRQHPKRVIEGFSCKRREVSGQRFWTLFKNVCGTPQKFAEKCLVYNHCPLIFMGKTGKNLTPPDMPLQTRNKVMALCDEALCKIIELYEVKEIVGLGRFAEARARKVLQENGMVKDVKVHFLIHPSPASPAANAGWDSLARESLEKSGILSII